MSRTQLDRPRAYRCDTLDDVKAHLTTATTTARRWDTATTVGYDRHGAPVEIHLWRNAGGPDDGYVIITTPLGTRPLATLALPVVLLAAKAYRGSVVDHDAVVVDRGPWRRRVTRWLPPLGRGYRPRPSGRTEHARPPRGEAGVTRADGTGRP